jgi:hypothetical protein
MNRHFFKKSTQSTNKNIKTSIACLIRDSITYIYLLQRPKARTLTTQVFVGVWEGTQNGTIVWKTVWQFLTTFNMLLTHIPAVSWNLHK